MVDYGYVLYASSILSSSSLLRSAAILMYVVGVLKYGERVFALMGADSCASSSLSATSYKDFSTEKVNDGAASQSNEVKLKGFFAGPASQSQDVELEISSSARPASQSNEVKLKILSAVPASQSHDVDLETSSSAGPASQSNEVEQEALELIIAYSLLDVPKQMFEGPTRYVKIKNTRSYEGKFMLDVVEMQLTMMYDLLYTKAAVMHTWYGFFVRAILLPFAVAALQLFHAALGDQDGYTRSDVHVTEVLLTGAVVLETMSVLRVVFSMWTATLLYERKWYKFSRVVEYAELLFFTGPMMLLVQRKGYWSGHMRQHELLKVYHYTHGSTCSRIAKRIGREDLWDSMFRSWSTRVPGDIIDRVLGLVSTTEEGQIGITESRGRNALSLSLGLGEDLAWSVGLDLDESIPMWHIATHVYLDWYRFDGSLKQPTEALCNYMFFLLAASPYMLPYPVTRQRYVQLCHDSISHIREALMGGSPFQPGKTAQPSVNTTLDRGCQLAAKLLHTAAEGADDAEKTKNAVGVLEMIFEVWVEMLCYTAYWCNDKSHAKNLTNGGELMTFVALMMVYMSNGFIVKKKKEKKKKRVVAGGSSSSSIPDIVRKSQPVS